MKEWEELLIEQPEKMEIMETWYSDKFMKLKLCFVVYRIDHLDTKDIQRRLTEFNIESWSYGKKDTKKATNNILQ